MATLASLPNELIGIICNELHPVDSHDPAGLVSLSALVLANRQLSSAVSPVLYHRGVRCHSHLPLAWAARYGLPGTLRRALAADADPNHLFRLRMPEFTWSRLCEIEEAGAAWTDYEPQIWPPDRKGGCFRVRRNFYGPRILKEVPTLRELDMLLFRRKAFDLTGDDDDDDYGSDAPESWDDLWREYTAMHVAAREGHKEIIDILLEHDADIDASSFAFCACRDPGSIWKLCLEVPLAGGESSIFAAQPWTPVHVAICSSQIETAKLLISRGARLGRTELRDGRYEVIHQVAESGHADLLNYILDRHPEIGVNINDGAELNPFYYAFASRRWDTTIPLLVSLGADINWDLCIRCDVQTIMTSPLGEACRLGRFEDALKLLDLGATARSVVVHLRGEPPVDPSIIPLLHLCCMDFNHKATGSWKPGVVKATEKQATSRSKVITRLLSAGEDPDREWDAGNAREYTPLCVAVQHLNLDAVKTLLAAGADVNFRDAKGRNALMMAVTKPERPPWHATQFGESGFLPCDDWNLPLANDYPNRLAIVRLLVDAGIQVNDTDANGNTALHFLFNGHRINPFGRNISWIQPRTSAQILRFLLVRGANPCLRNNANEPALLTAVKKECVYALEIMAKQGRWDLLDNFDSGDVLVMLQNTRFQSLDPQSVHGRISNLELEMKSRHLSELILEMDYKNRLVSDQKFLRACFFDNPPDWPMFDLLIGILCNVGFENTGFDSDLKFAIFCRTLDGEHWDAARQLLETLGADIDINEVDITGESPLYRAIEHGADANFVVHLVDAGADIHQVPPSFPDKQSPLMCAIKGAKGEMVQAMLIRQPIRGNTQAASALYLHAAVKSALDRAPENGDDDEDDGPGEDWTASQISIRALLAAGANPHQVDEEGDTPLLYLLRRMANEEPKDLMRAAYHWIKPLSKGVDINRPSKSGMTVGACLESILNGGHKDKALINSLLQLVPRKGNELGGWEIVWRL